jgi:hypothetical protein
MIGLLSTPQTWQSMTAHADSTTIVQNGGFEAGTTNWTYGQLRNIQGSFGVSTDVYSGSQSGRLSCTVYDPLGYCLVTQKVPVQSGEIYQITIHYKSSAVGSACLFVMNSDWTNIITYWARIPLSSSWATLQYQTTMIPTMPSGGFSEIRINIENTGQILLDEISITTQSTPTPPPTPNPASFISRGTVVSLSTLHPNARNYQPNGWAILQDLGVNVISATGGAEGYVWRWNINSYPNEWATNFNNFLSLADSHGIKVMFPMIGDNWGSLFGIACPEPYGGFSGVPLAQAKSMIDKLAGNNNLNHNFFTDPRVMAWSPANEIDLANSVTRDWVLQILDYMKSKGATVFVSCPRNTAYSSSWMESSSFQATEPIIRGHVDFMCYHDYRIYEVTLAKNAGQDIYTFTYNIFKQDLQNSVLNGRGSMPIDKIMLGEFGIWHGYDNGAGMGGLPANFTEADRGTYYRAVYQVCVDLGIKHIFNYDCFAEKEGNGNYQRRYEIVDVGGTYFTQCTSILKQYYK